MACAGWRARQDITEDGRAVPRLGLLEAQVTLFAQLCYDRNYIAIKYLRRDWPKELILHCLGTAELPRWSPRRRSHLARTVRG